MNYKNVLILFLIISGSAVKAQLPEIIYPGTVVYEGYYDDRSWGSFRIGFNFNFFGHPYNRFYVTSNGLLMFQSGSNDYTEDPIPSPSSPNNFIAAFWDDMVIHPSGKILYSCIGASPNRKCIIQWTNMGFYASNVLMGTFSVILYENSNDIRIQYRSIIDHTSPRSHGSSAVIGLENSHGTAGVQFAYHNPDAVSSGKAILFHPSGATYTIDSEATFDGIYLTKNIALPEPGIPILINPAYNAVIGTSQQFEWTSSSNANNYTLKISTNSDISESFDYNTGTNNTYLVSGLSVDATYYWAVFASNSTGTTWSEIYRFTTSASPPLAAVPQTIWTEQNEERLIKLQYTGGDGELKTAVLLTLPLQGSLYQYTSGTRGNKITSVPAIIDDKEMNLIYVADGDAGNRAGNFDFFIHDGTGDSPPAMITINVNPPGIPNFLLAAKSGNIEIQFDKPMNDPTGKEDQFIVKVNGTPVVISTVSLKPGDPNTIVVTLDTPLTGGETVLISYTQGDVTAESGGLLPSFVDEPVTFVIQTISFPALPEMTYGDPPLTLSATASSGLQVTFTSSNTTVASIEGNILDINSTGSANIIAMQVGDGTFAPARYIRVLNVMKAEQVITFPNPGNKTYGDPDFTLDATSSSGLPVYYSTSNPEVAIVAGNIVNITGAGTVIIIASQDGNNLYYSAIDVSVTITVSKADQTITFMPLPIATFGDDPLYPDAIASSGLDINFDSDNELVATINNDMIVIQGAGTATITASQAGNQNYNPAQNVSQILTVGKASQIISFPQISSVVYGSPDFNAGATSTSGLPIYYTSDNPSVVEITNGIIHITRTGTVNITASQPGDGNFMPAEDTTISLTVTKAHLTITADNKTRPYLSENPTLTYSCSGFVYSETIDVLDILPSLSTNATIDSPVGEYPILVSGGYDDCYDFDYVSGVLTIIKINQIVTFISYPEKLLVTESFEMQAVASSGLPVLFESDDIGLVSINGAIITGLSRGIAEVRASQEGNENYFPAEARTSVEIISTHENILYLFTPNNDGFNDYWEIPELESYGKCEVRVYNRWGKLVFSSTNYHNEWDGASDGIHLPQAAYYFIIKTEKEGTIPGTVNIIR
ncbi:MAG: gliding motility-associated C-terminal domain-containing protein [Bacteroidales bacterium]|nr:gliding motility-associated C-terminal domain-containing protein [Bacteroidales bacterium]